MNTTRGTTCPSCKKGVFVDLPDMKKGQRHTLKHTCCGHLRKVQAAGKINAGDPVVITPAGLAIATKDYPEPIMEEVESLASKVERLEKGINESLQRFNEALKIAEDYEDRMEISLKQPLNDIAQPLIDALKSED